MTDLEKEIVPNDKLLKFMKKKLKIKNLSKFKSDKLDDLEKNLVSCFGAIKIIKDGWETEAIPVVGDKTTEKKGFFAKIFRIH